jgi:hypothetical protein
MRCASCGHTAADGERFCEVCGKPLSPDTTAPGATPTPADTRPSKTETAASPATGVSRGAAVGQWAWTALGVALYGAIADAAGEALLHQAPARWWIAATAVCYLALSAAAWRLAPAIWNKIDWPARATVSLVLLLGGLALVIRLPDDAQAGVSLFGAPASLAATVVTLLACAGAGVVLVRNQRLPVAGRAVAAVLCAYGMIALALAIHSGTPYAALFHGGSQWVHLPKWLQGAVLGTLLLVPAAAIVELVLAATRRVRATISATVFGTSAFGLCVVLALVAWQSGSDLAGTELADATADPSSNAGQQPAADVKPGDSAAYQRASGQLDKVNSAVDALSDKVDRSLFEIGALADKLGPDPAASFRFVRDQIRYEPYIGTLRGALGTLISRAGNSLDRSLLLAALLQKNSLQVQIANGKLSDADARTLVLRVFEPIKPVPSALPALSELTPDLGQSTGIDPARLQKMIDSADAQGAAALTRLQTNATNQANVLSGLLAKAGLNTGSVTPMDRLIAEAKNHYWVRYQDSTGKWIDLDPAFPNATPGQSKTTADGTFAPDGVPDELYHTLHIVLTLRVASTSASDTGADQPLLDQELKVPDLQGKTVTVFSEPLLRGNSLNPGTSLRSVLDAAKVYQTMLVVGDDQTQGKSFDLHGHIATKASPDGLGSDNGANAGNANGGLFGAMSNAVGGDTAPKSEGRIVGEWVDYTVTSPGLNGSQPTTHHYRRDIIAPFTVTSWSGGHPTTPTVRPTNLADNVLRRRLPWSTDVLPVTGTPIPEYAAYLQLNALKAARPMLDGLAKLASGVPVDPNAFSQALPPVRTVLLASAGNYARGGTASIQAARTYFARPGLVAFETRVTSPDAAALTRGYDIVAWPSRVVINPSSGGASPAQAALLPLQSGALATGLELELTQAQRLGATGPALSASNVLTEAQTEGVPLVVLRAGDAGLAAIGGIAAPDSIKAELAADVAGGQSLIVPSRLVTVGGQPQYGWWRFDAPSGELIGTIPGERGGAFIDQEMTEYAIQALEVANNALCFAGAWKEGGTAGLGEAMGCFITLTTFGAGLGEEGHFWTYTEILIDLTDIGLKQLAGKKE